MAVSIYQDFSRIYDDIKLRIEVDTNNYTIDKAAIAAWNILCMIPNPDKEQYETVMNGIRNSFWAGQMYVSTYYDK